VDFSLHGGAILYIERSPNTVVSNSNFGFSIANDFDTVSVIRADPASPNLAVTGCIIDGFADGGAGNQGNALIQSAAGGMLVMRHNWLKNSPSHVLEVSGGEGMILDYRFNLIENIGNNGSSGNHPNLLEWDASYASASRVVVSHNTVLQVPGPQGPGEAFQFYSNGGPAVDNVTFSRNVVIAAGDPAHVSISYILHGNNFVAGIYSKNGSIQDNYFDLSGAYGPFYGRSFNRGWVVARNWNMITGAPLLPAPR
jgi:hypothetical protein